MLPVQVDEWYRTGASGIALSVLSMAAAAWSIMRLTAVTAGSASAGLAGTVLAPRQPQRALRAEHADDRAAAPGHDDAGDGVDRGVGGAGGAAAAPPAWLGDRGRLHDPLRSLADLRRPGRARRHRAGAARRRGGAHAARLRAACRVSDRRDRLVQRQQPVDDRHLVRAAGLLRPRQPGPRPRRPRPRPGAGERARAVGAAVGVDRLRRGGRARRDVRRLTPARVARPRACAGRGRRRAAGRLLPGTPGPDPVRAPAGRRVCRHRRRRHRRAGQTAASDCRHAGGGLGPHTVEPARPHRADDRRVAARRPEHAGAAGGDRLPPQPLGRDDDHDEHGLARALHARSDRARPVRP